MPRRGRSGKRDRSGSDPVAQVDELVEGDELVHRPGRIVAAGGADHARRHTDDRRVRRHRPQHHRARRHPGAGPDLDVAQDLGAGADHHAAADLGVAVAALLAGTAQGHGVEDRHVVLDHRGRADHEAGGVVEEDAPADPRGRMDVALEHLRDPALEVEGEVAPAAVPDMVGEAVGLQRVEALEVQDRLQCPERRRIPVDHRADIGAERLPDPRIRRDRLVEGVGDEFGRQRRVPEPGRDPVGDRAFQGGVVQDRRDDEGGELRLGPQDVLRLVPQPRPDRVDDREVMRGVIEGRTGAHGRMLTSGTSQG